MDRFWKQALGGCLVSGAISAASLYGIARIMQNRYNEQMALESQRQQIQSQITSHPHGDTVAAQLGAAFVWRAVGPDTTTYGIGLPAPGEQFTCSYYGGIDDVVARMGSETHTPTSPKWRAVAADCDLLISTYLQYETSMKPATQESIAQSLGLSPEPKAP